MRIARTLTVAVVLSTASVLGVNLYLRVQRESALFESDMRHDHEILGKSLAVAVSDVWQTGGADQARGFLARVNARVPSVALRWVWTTTPGADADRPLRDPALLDRSRAGDVDHWVDRTSDPGRLVSYVAIPVEGSNGTSIEISESLGDEHLYLWQTIHRTALWTAVVLLSSSLLTLGLMERLLARPVRRLMYFARRLAIGDMTHRTRSTRDDELGELARALDTMCDRMTESQSRLERETRAREGAMDQLRHADRLVTIGTLAAGLAHEIGTPLNVVDARARMIADGELVGAEAATAAQLIVEQTERIVRTIRRLLDFARPGRLHKTSVDVAVLTAQTLDLLAPLAAQHRVNVELRDGGVPSLLDADADRIQQVITNLCVNAIQAMPEGGELLVEIRRELAVRGTAPIGAQQAMLRIDVTDQGSGISEHDQARLFEPFFTTKDVGEGTGLGLAVSLGIVTEHRGWIEVKSQLGKGSRFSVFLPGAPGRSIRPEEIGS